MKHADGIARLIKLRGPERHRNEFDNTMFMFIRSILVRYMIQFGLPPPLFQLFSNWPFLSVSWFLAL